MKRSLVVIAVLGLFAGVAQANLLLNESFESGTGQGGSLDSATVDNWTFWGGGWWANDSGAVYDGTWAIKRWDDGTGMYQDFTASADTSYDFSLFAYDGSSEPLVDRRVDLRVEWYDGTDTKIGDTVVVDSFGAGTVDSYTELSGVTTSPASTSYGRFLITTESDGAAPGGSVFYDAASVDATVIPEPALAGLVLVGIGMVRMLRRRS